MKKSILYLWALLSIYLLGSGCSEYKDDVNWYSELYTFLMEDTVLTSEAHEFSLPVYMIENPAIKGTGWKIGVVEERNPTFWEDGTDEWLSQDKNIWITAENKDDELYIKVKSNDTEKERRARITVWKPDGKDYGRYGEIIIIQLPEEKEDDNAPFEVQVRYKGKLYSSIATLDDNDKLVYESMELDSLMESLMNRKDLDVVVTESGIMNIFDSGDAEALDAITDMRTCVAPGTPCGIVEPMVYSRAKNGFEEMNNSCPGFFAVFDDKTYDNSHLSQNLENFDDRFDIINLKGFDLNDKISSLTVGYNGTNEDVCAVLTVWEDTYFNFEDYDRTKHRVSFIATYENRRVALENLRSIQCINSRNTWNDRISSLSFHFGYYNNYWKDY